MKKFNQVSILILLINTFAFSLFAQDRKHFDKASLTKEQLKDFETFRSLEGKDRFDLFHKISKVIPNKDSRVDSITNLPLEENAWPPNMNKQDIYSLLGKPYREHPDRSYDYLLDKDSTHCMMSFFFSAEGELSVYAYANCKERWDKLDANDLIISKTTLTRPDPPYDDYDAVIMRRAK